MYNPIKFKAGIKSGEIPYYRRLDDEYGTYSIDRFTFNFRVPDLFYTLLQLELNSYGKDHAVEDFTAHRFNDTVRVYQYRALHMELWQGRPSSLSGEKCNCIKMDFNPNKCGDNDLLRKMFKAIREKSCGFTFDLSRVDFAYDIPRSIGEVYVLSRKTESNYGTTRYYGKPGSNGHLRVYDKKIELAQKDKLDIGREVTRLEWEQRGGKDLDFKFDTFCIADFKDLQYPASVIPFIQPENINTAFRNISRATRLKYRELLKPYPFYPQRFHELLSAYADEYGVMDNRWN